MGLALPPHLFPLRTRRCISRFSSGSAPARIFGKRRLPTPDAPPPPNSAASRARSLAQPSKTTSMFRTMVAAHAPSAQLRIDREE